MTTSLPPAFDVGDGHTSGPRCRRRRRSRTVRASATSTPRAAGRARRFASRWAASSSRVSIAAYFSCDGVRAVVVEHNKPLTQKQFTELQANQANADRRRSSGRDEGGRRRRTERSADVAGTWTAEEIKQMAEIRARVLTNPPNRQAKPRDSPRR